MGSICRYCNSHIDKRRRSVCDECMHYHLSVSSKRTNDAKYNDYIARWKSGLEDGVVGGVTTSNHIRRYITEKYNNACAICGWNSVNEYTGNVPVELEHIDGDFTNNNEDNLTLLCPNCHSLTPTYRGLNIGSGRRARRSEPIKRETRKNNRTRRMRKTKQRGAVSVERLCVDCGSAVGRKRIRCNDCGKVRVNLLRHKSRCVDCGVRIKTEATRCVKCNGVANRVVERPPDLALLGEIESSNYTALGRKYGVSDNAIRKWVKLARKRVSTEGQSDLATESDLKSGEV